MAHKFLVKTAHSSGARLMPERYMADMAGLVRVAPMIVCAQLHKMMASFLIDRHSARSGDRAVECQISVL